MRALFLGGLGITIAAAVWAWLDTGGTVAGIWLPAQKDRPRGRADRALGLVRKRRSVQAAARAAGVRLEVVPRLSRLPDVNRRASALEADILIVASFPFIVPEAMLGAFPHGGVNLHPALLPMYRGAHPKFWMLRRADEDRFGGATLHRITEGVDEGDIIAKLPVPRAGRSLDEWDLAIVDVMGELVAGQLRAWLSGDLVATAQPTAAGSYDPPPTGEHLDLANGWNGEEAVRFLLAAGSQYPLLLHRPDGAIVEVGAPARLLGSATGASARYGRRYVEADVGDHRLLAGRLTRRRMLLSKLNSFATVVRTSRGPFGADPSGRA
jgi:methionyl-tRNA formyltransferase